MAQRKHCTQFVVSTDEILGREAKFLLEQIAQHSETNWECPPSQAHNYVHTHMRVTIARTTPRCLRELTCPSLYVRAANGPPSKTEQGISLHQTNI